MLRGRTLVKCVLSRAQIAVLWDPTALGVSCRYKDEKAASLSRVSFTPSLSAPESSLQVLPSLFLVIRPPPGGLGNSLTDFQRQNQPGNSFSF